MKQKKNSHTKTLGGSPRGTMKKYLHAPMATPTDRLRNSEAQPPAPPAMEDPEPCHPKSPPSEEEETQFSTPPSSPVHHHWKNRGRNACIRTNQHKCKTHEGIRTIIQTKNF